MKLRSLYLIILVCCIFLIIPLIISTIALSIGNVQLVKAIDVTTERQGDFFSIDAHLNKLKSRKILTWFDFARRSNQENKRAQIGEAIVAFGQADYDLALDNFLALQEEEGFDSILLQRILDSAWRAGEKEVFLDLYLDKLYPNELTSYFTQRFRPTAAAFAADLARQQIDIASQQAWIDVSLSIWPDNLCALSTGAILFFNDAYVAHISKGHFDGAFSTDDIYQACLLNSLSEIVESYPDSLTIVLDILERWIWQERIQTSEDIFTYLRDFIPPSVAVYRVLGEAYWLNGEWQSAQDMYKAASKLSSDLTYREIAKTIALIGSSKLPEQLSPYSVVAFDRLDVLWAQAQKLLPIPSAQDASLALFQLHDKLLEIFKDSRAKVPLNSDWLLRGWYVDKRQLALQQRVTVWFLIDTQGIPVQSPTENWINLGPHEWVIRVNEINLVPNAGFEIGTGVGEYVPPGYIFLAGRSNDLALAFSNQHKAFNTNRTLILTRSSENVNVAIASERQAIKAGHLYFFNGWLKAEHTSRPGRGAVLYAQWFNPDGKKSGYQRLISGASPIHWRQYMTLFQVPDNIIGCELNLYVNDPGNTIWFDDLMIVDVTRGF